MHGYQFFGEFLWSKVHIIFYDELNITQADKVYVITLPILVQ